METDLSLLEIGREDDSLLQQITNNNRRDLDLDIGSTVDFSCSPLQTLRSNKRSDVLPRIPPTGVLKDNEEMERPFRSSPRDISNKENLNGKNFGIPQQIKRRKKGGGYNLRKSLAWDKAFFTDEGVLDPLELSILSGSLNKSSGELLSSIHEEGRTSLSNGSDLSNDEEDLQTLEENLYKELPARPIGRKVGDGLLPRSHSSAREAVAPVSVASRKVHLAKGVNRNVSHGGGCPRHLGSSSQKRLPNTNTTMKDSKLPKFPASKSDSSSLPTTTKNAIIGTKRSKCNQIAAPVNVRKNVGLKGSINNTSSSPNNTKDAPDCISLSSVQRSGKYTTNLPSETHVPTNPQIPLITKYSTTGLRGTSDSVLTVTNMHAPTGRAGSSKVAVSLSQNDHYVGKNIQYAHFQTTKPSGLRMPSPSLGFFGQPKASAPHSQSQRNTTPCKLPESYISNPRKLSSSNYISELKPLHMPGRLPKVVADVTKDGNIGALSSTMKCLIPSVVTPASHQTLKSNSELENLQKVEVKILPEPKCSSNQTSSKKQSHSILDYVDKHFQEQAELQPDTCEVEKTSHEEDLTLQGNDNKLLLESGSSEQSRKSRDLEKFNDVCPKSRDSSGSELEGSCVLHQPSSAMQVKVVDGVDDNIEHLHVENTQLESLNTTPPVENQDFISDLHSGDANCNPGTSMAHSECLRVSHDVDEQSGKQAELIKPGLYEAEQISHENQRLQMNYSILLEQSTPFEESQKDYDCGSIANYSLNSQGFNGSELETHGSSQLSSVQVKEGAAGVDNMIKKSHVEDAQLQLVNSNSSDESNLGTSTMHSNCLGVGDDADEQSGEQPELRNPFPDEVEQVLRKENHRLQMNDDILLIQSRSSEEFERENDLENVINVTSERRDSCGNESKSFHAPSQLTPAIQVKGSDNMIEHPHVEDAPLGSINIDLSVENHEFVSDTQFRNAINLSDRRTSVGYESSLRSSKDQTARAATTCILEAVCSSTEELGFSARTISNGSIPRGIEDSNIFLDEIETNLSQNSKIPNGESQCELESGVSPTKDICATMPAMIKSLSDTKQDALAMKSQLNAVPFSDEWLAALEYVGEDILTMKTGAVQNSPPDKSLPEPSPWSPVKRKSNQEIGPFDCTKYTNLPPTSSE